ncbi:hypothetical protein Pla52o_14180 [Novipirellula galeiformis]|uniref:Uncharacterized protein n=1 Tax=Novipirellula galeiformis TaxID=2528004 RepID=A0A5C6CKJ6_9BACT|nr:hypothetical protein [Novipirellula galeiformis]TWU25120.1 hypothetical protein Pla52o_14180 [Novipirellula galeiformis]
MTTKRSNVERVTPEHDNSTVEEIKEALTDDQHSIDERAPGSPFTLVALSYLGILALACLVIAAFLWLT